MQKRTAILTMAALAATGAAVFLLARLGGRDGAGPAPRGAAPPPSPLSALRPGPGPQASADPVTETAPARPRQPGPSWTLDGEVLRRASGAAGGDTGETAQGRGGGDRIAALFPDSDDAATPDARVITGGLRALRDSGRPLSFEERQSAYRLLESTSPPGGLVETAWHWVVDEMLSTLRAPHGSDELIARLEALYRNDALHMVVRDYALQHLGHLHGEGADPVRIERVLAHALGQGDGTLAGVALLALRRSARDEGLATDLDLGAAAHRVAADPGADLRSRLSAIQVAGKQGHTDALPLAAELAGDPAQPVPLRMSAVATIADLGAAGDHQPLLQELGRSGDVRLRTAAGAALQRAGGGLTD